jgi:Xaa-Pro aminopeptidase
MNLVKSKISQAQKMLAEMDIDLWVIYCRESEIMTDPSLEMVVGQHVSAQGAFLITRQGTAEAVVWVHDADNIERTGCYDKINTFTTNFQEVMVETISRIDPEKIALNFSLSSSTADGISYGMYLRLKKYLKETPYADRFISSEEFLIKLRSRKTPDEVEMLRQSAQIADQCWHESLNEIRTGLSEIEIAHVIAGKIKEKGYDISFPTIVNAGAKTHPGHGLPTDAVLEPGDLLHVDFGAKVNGYCSDLQRLAYFKKSGETEPPEVLDRAFKKIREIIQESNRRYKTGAQGFDIDKHARSMLTKDGYEEYQHSLGHQIGRAVHDGGSRIGPKYEDHDNMPFIPLEPGNTFTVELGVSLKDIGYVGLEEDLVVTDDGGQFLCDPQTELPVL